MYLMILQQGLATEAAADLLEMAATMAVFGIETCLLLQAQAAEDFVCESGTDGMAGRVGIAELAELGIRIFIYGSNSDTDLPLNARLLDEQQARQMMDTAKHITGW